MREVTLVAGPPCGGKSTHVQQHVQPGDLLVCLDLLAQAAGSPHPHAHSREHLDVAAAEYARLLDHIAAAADVRAWIIRCAPEGHEREALARHVRATRTLVLAPPFAVTLARAQRTRPRRVQGVVRGWYRRYTPADGDMLITTSTTSRTW